MKPTLKQIKWIPILLLLFIFGNLALSLSSCIANIGETKILNVNVKNLKSKTYQRIEIDENSFQTGTEGLLYWKVKNFEEAF